MAVAKFSHCAQLIADNLASIIEQCESLSRSGSDIRTNPLFREVVNAQERILNATEALLSGAIRP